jgi:hypothetical protein
VGKEIVIDYKEMVSDGETRGMIGVIPTVDFGEGVVGEDQIITITITITITMLLRLLLLRLLMIQQI